jgi:hypothetical protein
VLCIWPAQHVPCVFNDGVLKPTARAEEGNRRLSSVANGNSAPSMLRYGLAGTHHRPSK